MRKPLVLLLLPLVLLGCPPGVTPPGTNQCAAAEQNLLKLQCKDSRGYLLGGPNKSGVAFHDVCIEDQNNSIPLNPACLAQITDCKEVDPCLQSN